MSGCRNYLFGFLVFLTKRDQVEPVGGPNPSKNPSFYLNEIEIGMHAPNKPLPSGQTACRLYIYIYIHTTFLLFPIPTFVSARFFRLDVSEIRRLKMQKSRNLFVCILCMYVYKYKYIHYMHVPFLHTILTHDLSCNLYCTCIHVMYIHNYHKYMENQIRYDTCQMRAINNYDFFRLYFIHNPKKYMQRVYTPRCRSRNVI